MLRQLLPLCAGLILSPAASPTQLACDDEACCGELATGASVAAVPTAPNVPAAMPTQPAQPTATVAAVASVAPAAPVAPVAPMAPVAPAIAVMPAAPTPAAAPAPARLAYATSAPAALAPLYAAACDPECEKHAHGKSKSKSKDGKKSKYTYSYSFESDGDDDRRIIIRSDGEPHTFEVEPGEDFEWKSEDGSVYIFRSGDGQHHDARVFVNGDSQVVLPDFEMPKVELPDLGRFGVYWGDDEDGGQDNTFRVIRPRGKNAQEQYFLFGDGEEDGDKPFVIRGKSFPKLKLKAKELKDKAGKMRAFAVGPDSDVGRWALELAEQAEKHGAQWAEIHGEDLHEHAEKWARWAAEHAHELGETARVFAVDAPEAAAISETVRASVERALAEVRDSDHVRDLARQARDRARGSNSQDETAELMRDLRDVIQDIRSEVRSLREEVGSLRERVRDER